MKKLFLNPTYLLLLLLITTVSCKDDKDPEPSKRDILTEKTWTGQSVWVQGDDVTEAYKDQFGLDVTKNTLKFDKAGTYVDSYEGNSDNGTWEFTENETKILFDKGTSNEYLGTILKLDADELNVMFSNSVEFRYRR